jgi:hypothetical protein
VHIAARSSFRPLQTHSNAVTHWYSLLLGTFSIPFMLKYNAQYRYSCLNTVLKQPQCSSTLLPPFMLQYGTTFVQLHSRHGSTPEISQPSSCRHKKPCGLAPFLKNSLLWIFLMTAQIFFSPSVQNKLPYLRYSRHPHAIFTKYNTVSLCHCHSWYNTTHINTAIHITMQIYFSCIAVAHYCYHSCRNEFHSQAFGIPSHTPTHISATILKILLFPVY